MKRCPKCRRDYFDDSLMYCLDDGASLLEGPASLEPATEILSGRGTPDGEAQTRLQIEDTADTKPVKSGIGSATKLAVGLGLVTVLLGFGIFGYRYSYSSEKKIESIAIMPFTNESGNADVEYLSDGMTESLINSLSRIPNLSVKAPSSVSRYKGKDLDPQQIAAELKVQAVLNGRVLQHGDDLVLNLYLVDASTGNQIWGDRYDRKMTDLVTLQNEIANDVSNKLTQKLSGVDVRPGGQTANPEAYQLYMKGRYLWNKRTIEDLRKSIEYFQQAIDKDPSYALAYAGMADSYETIPDYSEGSSNDAYPNARVAAQKALEIDPDLAEAHTTLAAVLWNYDWKFAESEQEFKRAIALNPNYPTAHHWYGEYLLAVGRNDEALAEMKLAQSLDPQSLIINGIIAAAYAQKGQNDLAIQQLKDTIELNPRFPRTHLFLAGAYEADGRFDDAISEWSTAFTLMGVPNDWLARYIGALREGLRSGGPTGYWRKQAEIGEKNWIENVKPRPPRFEIAASYALAGDRDKAFEWLEKTYDEHGSGILGLNDRRLDGIRSDPRMADLKQRVGLP